MKINKKKIPKNKLSKSKILLYLSSIIIGFFITSNFNFNGINKFFNFNSVEYQALQDKKNRLNSKVSALEKENKELNSKILGYSSDDNKSERIINDMKEQIRHYGMVNGQYEVRGEGIKIKITDGIPYPDDTEFEVYNKILHDKDMRNVINAAKIAGGEAISVNNHRVTIHTAVQCNGTFLLFDDGSVEMAPFNVYIIGDPESVKANITKEDGYLKTLMARGLSVEIESSSDIRMPAANLRSLNFAKEYINK